MNRFLPCLLFLLIIRNCSVFAQIDSVYTDTVIVLKEPHVVKRKFYAYDPSLPQNDTSYKWSGEIFLLAGKSASVFAKENNIFSGKSLDYGLLLLRHSKNFEYGLGISVLHIEYSRNQHQLEVLSGFQNSRYSKISDTIIDTFNGKDSAIYVNTEQDTINLYQFNQLINKKLKDRIDIIKFPISFGYSVNIWRNRLKFIPRVQLVPGLIFQSTSPEMKNINKLYWSYTGQLSISYSFSKRVSALAKSQFQSTVNSNSNSFNWNAISYGLGLVGYF